MIVIAIAVILLLIKIYLVSTAGICKSKNLMKGKVVIVTGANRGIGYETALDIAGRGGKVILACRNIDLGLTAARNITAQTKNSSVTVHKLDLSSLDSVRDFASAINATEDRLDVLIHNAGMSPPPGLTLTKHNLEVQFAANYLGPFLLTHLLIDLLKKTAPSRIIVVSSVTHFLGTIDLDNLNCEKYVSDPFWVYCNTKLANLLFVRELSRKLDGTGVTINALHPGGVKTAIARNGTWIIKYVIVPVIYLFLKDSKSGAQTSIYLAVSDEVHNVTGKYYVDCKPANTSCTAKNEEIARKLWEKSKELTGIKDKHV